VANTDAAAFKVANLTNAPGHLTAAPGLAAMEIGRVGHCCGTSNATALASRYAGLVHEKIVEFELPEDCDQLTDAHTAALLKTMLVHGASWGDATALLEQVFETGGLDWRERIRLLQQFLTLKVGASYGTTRPAAPWVAASSPTRPADINISRSRRA